MEDTPLHKQGVPGKWGATASPFPDLETLTVGINSVFQAQELGQHVTVLARNPNLRSGRRSPSEIVTVRLKDGSLRRLFCKYGGYDWHSHALWGVAYEVEIYRQVLVTLDINTAKFHGVHTIVAPDKICLVLEYLEDCEELKSSSQPGAMIEASRWLGRFHSATEELISEGAIPFLKIFDTAYYREWAKRTKKFAASQRRSPPWLTPLCQKWEELAESLVMPPFCIIHGDFYGSNILMRGNVPFVVDWESAAAAAGEIDLAFHTNGWPEEIVTLCETEYRKTRWPENPPAEFDLRLQASRLYQQFRWLGDHPDWISGQAFQRLRTLAERLELI